MPSVQRFPSRRSRRSRRAAVLAVVVAFAAVGWVLAPATLGSLTSDRSSVPAGPAAAPKLGRSGSSAPAASASRRRASSRRSGAASQRAARDGRKRRRAARDSDRVNWRASVTLGTPTSGALRNAVRLPAEGRTFVTWDPVLRRIPNRPDRRNASAGLVRVLLGVAAGYARAHPDGARLLVGDLSRPQGGNFGVAFGDLGDGQGHASHQNGLDADVYYPRRDGRERGPPRGGPEDVMALDPELSQELVNRFVAAGAQVVFVGTGTGLTGPPGVVQALPRHNDHLHVRFAPR